MKSNVEDERRRGGQITSNTPVARLAISLGRGYRAMAQETGISYPVMKRLGSGDYRMSLKNARLIAGRYDVSAEYVMGLNLNGNIVADSSLNADAEWKPWHLAKDPAGVAEQLGLSSEERDAALVAALNDCARIIDHVLPPDKEDQAQIGDVCTWFSRKKYSEHEVARMRPEFKRALKVISEMEKSWRYASPVAKKKQRGEMRHHFADAFFTHLPPNKVKAHTSMMRCLDDLARDACDHPQAPLIRKDIIKSLLEIRNKYKVPRI